MIWIKDDPQETTSPESLEELAYRRGVTDTIDKLIKVSVREYIEWSDSTVCKIWESDLNKLMDEEPLKDCEVDHLMKAKVINEIMEYVLLKLLEVHMLPDQRDKLVKDLLAKSKDMEEVVG